MNKDIVEKTSIAKHWTQHAPGLERGIEIKKEINKEFFCEIDNYRKKSEPYIGPLLDQIAKKGGRVIEIGCGMGYDSRELSKNGLKTVSCDLCYDNVKKTKLGYELLNLKGSCVNLDAENLPFKDSSFDTFYSFGVLHHTPDTKKAINEAYRVLKPNGLCLIMLYHKGYAFFYIMIIKGWFFIKRLFMSETELISKYYDFTPLSKMYSRDEAKRLFKGFSEIKFEVTTNGFGGVVNSNLKWLHKIFHKFPFILSLLGSFLIIKARK